MPNPNPIRNPTTNPFPNLIPIYVIYWYCVNYTTADKILAGNQIRQHGNTMVHSQDILYWPTVKLN